MNEFVYENFTNEELMERMHSNPDISSLQAYNLDRTCKIKKAYQNQNFKGYAIISESILVDMEYWGDAKGLVEFIRSLKKDHIQEYIPENIESYLFAILEQNQIQSFGKKR